MKGFTRVGAVMAAAVVLGAPAAQAHDYPVGSSPESGSTVSRQPGRVSVTFNDLVLTRPAPPDLVVQGPDGRHFETGCASLTDKTVSVPANLGPDGRYTVTWRVVSADGHPVSGTSAFTWKATAGQHRGPGSAHGQACGSSDHSEDQHTAWAPFAVAGGCVLAALIGVAAILVRSRRRPVPEDDEE